MNLTSEKTKKNKLFVSFVINDEIRHCFSLYFYFLKVIKILFYVYFYFCIQSFTQINESK